MGKKRKKNPWRAARARVWHEDGWWKYEITNWKGRIVHRDYAGSYRNIAQQARNMVWAVRQMDGIGHKLKSYDEL